MKFSIENIYAKISESPQFSLKDISFSLLPDEILGLVGESGAGKSSLLNVIAGFIPIQKGSIQLSEQVLSSPKKIVKPSQRSVAYIFQKENLLPFLSLYDNLILGLPKIEVAKRHKEILRLIKELEIDHFINKYPNDVSGGQQQRIALGRALLNDKQLLLFDEAFSGLDKGKAYELAHTIRAFIRHHHQMGIFVTHQIEEAFLIADKVGILRDGNIIQLNTPENIYHKPVSSYTAQFIGPVNYLTGTKTGNTVRTEFGVITVSQERIKRNNTKRVTVLTRPDDYLLKKGGDGPFQVTHIHFLGMQKIVTVSKERASLAVLIAHEQDIQEGERVEVSLRNSHPYFLIERKGKATYYALKDVG